MKVACVLIKHLRVEAELHRNPQLKPRTVILADRSRSPARVVDARPEATLAAPPPPPPEAALIYPPHAVVLEADEAYYCRVFRQALAGLLGVSARVEAAELGLAYVAIDGLGPMYGGEARLVATLLNLLPRWLNPGIGVGEGKFPALVAARSSRAPGAVRVSPDAAKFLAPHPVDLLPVSSSTRAALHRLGFHTLGQVADMPADLALTRFGPEGWRAWNLARGRDDRPLNSIRGLEQAPAAARNFAPVRPNPQPAKLAPRPDQYPRRAAPATVKQRNARPAVPGNTDGAGPIAYPRKYPRESAVEIRPLVSTGSHQ